MEIWVVIYGMVRGGIWRFGPCGREVCRWWFFIRTVVDDKYCPFANSKITARIFVDYYFDLPQKFTLNTLKPALMLSVEPMCENPMTLSAAQLPSPSWPVNETTLAPVLM